MKIQHNTVSLLIINDHVENKQNLTYARLFPTHDQIWMMFRHLGFFDYPEYHANCFKR